MAEKETEGHSWSFFRAGGFDQVKLESGADLMALDRLDQKLWVALSCPTSGLEFDSKTLGLIDLDKDGRIRATEIIAAAKWACACLKDPDILFEPPAPLPLDAIDDSKSEGQRILATARRILTGQGKPEATSISIEDLADAEKIFSQLDFNGDGVVPPESAPEPLRSVILDIISCMGSRPDRSGKSGVDQEISDRFFAECEAFLDWWKLAEGNPAILPLGESSIPAAGAINKVAVKIDDYFARCRLASFDARAIMPLNRDEKDYLILAARDLSVSSPEISALPLSHVEPKKPLSLREKVNPAWEEAVERFNSLVVAPLLGDRDILTDEEWTALKARFEPYQTWVASKPAVSVEKLGLDRIRQITADGGKEAVAELIAWDKALETEFNSIVSVDRLARYRRDLVRLLNNFVSFRDFYGRREKAIFQAGTLFLDQRSCELCIRVEDMAKLASIAHLSRNFLVYCECIRRGTGEKMIIAAAVTDGDADNLTVGRNGIFYDRQGRDWDATVVKIMDNPISIQQAFWAPYKRVIRWVEEQVAKRAAVADAAADEKLKSHAVTVVTKPEEAAKPEAVKSKFDVGVVAALGVAVGGITAALGAIMQSFFGLGLWMPLGFLGLGLMFMISGPSLVIAWLKMRGRNLGPLLDANGWAINATARINIPFGHALTGMAKLPDGSHRDLVDLFAEKHDKRRFALIGLVLLLLVATAWYAGGFNRILPISLQHSIHLGSKAALPTIPLKTP